MSAAYLSRLLDTIDQKSGKVANLALTNQTAQDVLSTVDRKLPDNWASFVDPTSKKTYYHNYSTGVTQWDKPEGFVEVVASSSSALLPDPEAVVEDEIALSAKNYQATASFNKANGRFANMGDDTYWQRHGRQNDKAGRQIQAFIGIDELEKNREETKAKKAEVQEKMKKLDWKKLNEERKKAKKRKAMEWLLKDDEDDR